MHQQSVHSGDKTLLHFNDGKITAIAATSTLTIRQQDSQHWQNQGFILTKNTDRSIMHINNKLPVEIKKIVLFNINDAFHDIKKVEYPSSLHTLFPLLFDFMRGDVVVGNGLALLDGSISYKSRQYAMEQLHKALQHIPVVHIQGTSQKICDTIINL